MLHTNGSASLGRPGVLPGPDRAEPRGALEAPSIASGVCLRPAAIPAGVAEVQASGAPVGLILISVGSLGDGSSIEFRTIRPWPRPCKPPGCRNSALDAKRRRMRQWARRATASAWRRAADAHRAWAADGDRPGTRRAISRDLERVPLPRRERFQIHRGRGRKPREMQACARRAPGHQVVGARTKRQPLPVSGG